MYPLAAQQVRKTRKDYGTKRGRHYTSSSSAFVQPSSSHLNDDDDDDDDDGNDEGTSRASTPSPTRFVNSLSNDIPPVFSNPPNIDPNMEPFYTHQTKILNHQVQLRDEQRGGLRTIGKGIKNMFYLVTKLGDGAACGDVMECTLPIQGMGSIISMVSISPEGFMPSILLLVVVIVTVVIVVVILVVVVVAIDGVVIVVMIIGIDVVVMIIGVVVVGGGVSFIKFSLVIIGFLHMIVFCYQIH
nr:hypothetical protein [Tanacetum cinerariifolium]